MSSATEVTQSSLDERTRSIYLFGQVDESMTQLVIPAVMTWAYDDQEEPIHVHLMTDGGALACGLAIYDVLRGSPTPIVTHAHGDVLSTGVIIYLAGETRTARPFSSMMLHRPYSGVNRASADEYLRTSDYLGDQETRIDSILATAGCPYAFGGPIRTLHQDVWIHGSRALVGAGVATIAI